MTGRLFAVCASTTETGNEKTLAASKTDLSELSDRHGLPKHLNEEVGLCMLHSNCRVN